MGSWGSESEFGGDKGEVDGEQSCIHDGTSDCDDSGNGWGPDAESHRQMKNVTVLPKEMVTPYRLR
jgi:hypothetical protein